MSMNTYFAIRDKTGQPDYRELFKTTDPNQRARLRRRGWVKVQRVDVDRAVGRGTAAALAKEQDGRYCLTNEGWMFIGNPTAEERGKQ